MEKLDNACKIMMELYDDGEVRVQELLDHMRMREMLTNEEYRTLFIKYCGETEPV
jgi:hypothetical protein